MREVRDGEDREVGSGEEAPAGGGDPFTVRVPSAMDMYEALQRRRGEGRFRPLSSMIAETLRGRDR
jgi:hypothetical protein